MKKWIWLTVVVALVPGVASADVTLEGDIGAATVRVEGEVTGVDYDGYSVFAQHDGYALVSVFDATEHGSLTIYGDTGDYTVEVAVNANADDIVLSEAVDAPGAAPQDDGGQSIADMDAEAFLASVVIGPDSPWYWT
jgi:hypothetical protein